jgi:hypothetical protein
MAPTAGSVGARESITLSCRVRTAVGDGAAAIVRIQARTISLAPLLDAACPRRARSAPRPRSSGILGQSVQTASVCRVSHRTTEDLAIPGGAHAGCDHDGTRDHLVAEATLDVGGTSEQGGNLEVVESAGATAVHLLVQERDEGRP